MVKRAIGVAYLLAFFSYCAAAQPVPSPSLNPPTTLPLKGTEYTFCDQSNGSAYTTYKCTVSQLLAPATRPVIYAKDPPYNAKCDNSTDDTTALNAFFAAVGVARFQAGMLPPGVCRFSSTLTLPANGASIIGSGRYSTVLYYIGSSTTTDLVRVYGTSGSSLQNGGTYSGFSIQSGTAMTGGAALHINWAANLTFNDFASGAQQDVTHNLYHGTWVENSGQIHFDGYESSYVAGDGIRVDGGGTGAPPQYDLDVKGCLIQADTISGIHMGGGWDGVNFDDCTVVGNGTNVLIDTAIQSFGNQEAIFGPRFYANAPTGNGTNIGDNFVINDSLANPLYSCLVRIMSPTTGAVHGNGVNVVHWPNCYVNIDSPEITYNNKSGLYVQDTSTIVNVSPQTVFSNNSRYGIEASSATSNVTSFAQVGTNTLGQSLNISKTSLNGAGSVAVAVAGVGVHNFYGGTAPSESGSPIYTAGSQFTASNNCGGTITGYSGGPAGGYFTVGTGGTNCQITITIGGANPTTAPHNWFCMAEDFTAGVNLVQIAQTTTTCVFKVPTLTASDIIQWGVVTGY